MRARRSHLGRCDGVTGLGDEGVIRLAHPDESCVITPVVRVQQLRPCTPRTTQVLSRRIGGHTENRRVLGTLGWGHGVIVRPIRRIGAFGSRQGRTVPGTSRYPTPTTARTVDELRPETQMRYVPETAVVVSRARYRNDVPL